jgi:tRNA-specific 2-thiouridylase
VAGTERLYVLALDAADNALIVGPADELGQETCLAQQVNWIAGEPPGDTFEATAKIRYQARDAAVSVRTERPDRVRVQFAETQRDITPGQAIVFYQGEQVLGGGTIARPDDVQETR